jgi:hypothetical protein
MMGLPEDAYLLVGLCLGVLTLCRRRHARSRAGPAARSDQALQSVETPVNPATYTRGYSSSSRTGLRILAALLVLSRSKRLRIRLSNNLHA